MSEQSSAGTRDLRIDFFRGAALLGILWQHQVELSGVFVPLYLQLSAGFWGISHQAEAFIFLSGLVFGLVYGRVLQRRGFGSALAKAIGRAWQLYATQATVLLLVLGLVSLARVQWQFDLARVPDLDLAPLFDAPGEHFGHVATLRFFPYGFDILPLYILLVLAGPAVLWLARDHIRVLLLLSGGLYVGAQLGFNLPAPLMHNGTWFFNPFAYQLLFVAGIVISQRPLRLPGNPWLLVGGAVVIVAVAYLKLIPRVEFPWADKTNLGPLRIAYFIVLAYVVAVATRHVNWNLALLRPLVVTGQHSLAVFAFGLLLTFTGTLVMQMLGPDLRLTIVVLLSSLAISVLYAHGLRALNRAVAPPRSPVQPVPASGAGVSAAQAAVAADEPPAQTPGTPKPAGPGHRRAAPGRAAAPPAVGFSPDVRADRP
jgi:hypothetical protein